MKIWQKIFLCSLSLFLIALNGGAFLLAGQSYRQTLDSERSRSRTEHSFIASALNKDYEALLTRGETQDAALSALFKTYSLYYGSQGIFLELAKSGGEVYTNLPVRPAMELSGKTQTSVVAGGKYLLAMGPMNDQSIYLITARSIEEMQRQADDLTRWFVLGGAGMSILLSIILYLMLRKLTAPIAELSRAAGEIAGGAYTEHARVTGRDEVAELAVNFNRMADEVAGRIAKLSESDAGKQIFIDNLAHEIRTPLTAIKGYAEYLQTALVSEDERISALGFIASESERLAEIGEKLLFLANLRENGLEMKPVRLAALFEEIENSLRHEAQKREVRLDFVCGGAVWRSDETLLYMLLVNITHNALRACGPGGNVRIVAGAGFISVADDGRGLSGEEISRVLEPFYRADKARARSEGGAGLGLAICESIANKLSIELEFESQVGRGTTVRIFEKESR